MGTSNEVKNITEADVNGIENNWDVVTTPSRESQRISRDALLVLCIALVGNSVLRGLSTPSGWAAAGLLVNYDYGFSRRALLGAIIAWIDVPLLYTFNFIFWFSFAILSANVIALVGLITRLFDTGSTDAKLSSLVFASSFSIVFLANCIGIPEQIPLLVTIIALQIKRFYARVAFVSILFPACLLIHESALAMFLPVICYRFLADIASQMDRNKVVVLGALAIVMTVLGLMIGTASLSKSSAMSMYQLLQAKADFPLNPSLFKWLMRNARDIMDWSFDVYSKYPPAWKLLIQSLIITLPSTIYLLLNSVKLLRAGGYHWVLCAGAIFAGMSPLLLDFIGAADTHRYNAMGTTASFLVFATTLLYFRVPSRTKLPTAVGSYWLMPAVVVLLNVGSTMSLIHPYVVQNFPYERHADYLMNLLSDAEQFPPRPPTDFYPPASVITDHDTEYSKSGND